MKSDFDIAVVGSGFAGSLTSMILRRLGHSVVMLERGKHPRFVIGESSTPLANLLLEELAHRYDLAAVLPLSKWGSWQREHPKIGCGLKRGFTFYHHVFHQPFDPSRDKQLLVAASPHDEIADTHWYRPDFDYFLVQEAQRLGVEYIDECRLDSLTRSGDQFLLEGKTVEQRVQIQTRFVIDASGPRGFLHRALGLRELPFAHLPRTQALYTHFRNVRRVADMNLFGADVPPYSVDDAAMHHVFDGGWIWVLRFNNGITSAGVAATDRLSAELNFAEGERAWKRLLKRLPMVQEQFADAQALFPFIHLPRVSFRSEEVSGKGWALLPSAAGFVDPLLSTGFPLTLIGIMRLAKAVEQDWGSQRFSERLASYAKKTLLELAAAERLVAALYANMKDFAVFAALSLLYFAAASYAETARRLGKPELASSFLLFDHPAFGPAAEATIAHALGERESDESPSLVEQVRHVIEPINVAGFGDPARQNWYPVKASDLLNAAGKFGVTPKEIGELLRRCGFDRGD